MALRFFRLEVIPLRNLNAKIAKISEIITSSGDLFKPVLSGKLMADGTIKLSEIDRIDIKAEINSHASTCDMAYILSRLKVGDVSVLNQKVGAYGDFTVFPKTYAEMLQLVQAGEAAFDSLPLEVRTKFDNNVNKWFSQIGTDEWCEKMNVEKPTFPVDVRPDLKEDVSLSSDA